MINVPRGWLLVTLILLVLSGCKESKTEETSMTIATHISASQWQALEKKRVVFGHQSVGGNIFKGVEHLAKRDGVNVDINEQRTAPTIPSISHFYIGKNGDPTSKIQDFAAAINAGAAKGADVAMMKLCYVDFNTTTDAKQVANDYIANLEFLAKSHPETNFVAITAPLTAVQTGIKAWIKRLLGKQPSEYVENAKRAEFNTLLRERYLAAGRLFDLAKIETEATGIPCMAQVDGQTVEVLCPEITNDGGHLNERGQLLVGAAFVNFISSLPAKQVVK
jgi:hypothetical protein